MFDCVFITEFGERLYQQCKNLEQQWQQLDSFIYAHKSEPQGKLTISISHVFGEEPSIAEFKDHL